MYKLNSILICLLLFFTIGCSGVIILDNGKLPTTKSELISLSNELQIEIENLEEQIEQDKKNIELAIELDKESWGSNNTCNAMREYDNDMFFLQHRQSKLSRVQSKLTEIEQSTEQLK